MIVIPMAGRSSRFFRAGFTQPKYQLPLWGRPMFDWVLIGFQRYFESEHFRFITLNEHDNERFISDRCKALGIRSFDIIVLEEITSGQAETVFNGIADLTDESLFIFNADSFHKDFTIPDYAESADAGLDVFFGEGTHWSFIEPGESSTVVRTTEKQRISEYCSDGLYYFRTAEIFRDAYSGGSNEVMKSTGETYIAPLYNPLIESGRTVMYRLVSSDSLFFCGTPAEYEQLQSIECPFSPIVNPEQSSGI